MSGLRIIKAPAYGPIADLRPYLRIKAPHASLALDLQENLLDEMVGEKTGDPFPWYGPEYDPFEHREHMRREMVDELNQWRRDPRIPS